MTREREFAFAKYFRRHPTPSLPGLEKFSRIVVIPAYDEMAFLPETLDSVFRASDQAPVAVIVVVNHPPEAPETVSRATLEYLQKEQLHESRLFCLYAPSLVGGVGRARKLGMDAALFAHASSVGEDLEIYSLDADTLVAENYFAVVGAAFREHPEVSGFTLPYRHLPESPETEPFLRNYERYLADYVEQLRRAGSPYAISTIGSAFACRGAAYLRCGGMKVRAAGEDFYFLTELVKTGKVLELTGEPLVFPSGRISGRTPFGTGTAVAKLASGGALTENSPAAFAALGAVLTARSFGENLTSAEKFLAALPPEAQDFFRQEKFSEVWGRILSNTPADPAARQAAFDRWFDGLKTLRFLHRASLMRGSAAT